MGGATGAAATLPFQTRSFDDLGTPLHQVSFCVLDLETTGGSPATCAITEVGAVKVRGGAFLGTFQTLVNPGMAIPPEIVLLTGITEAMVGPAPTIDEVLPSLLEFLAGCVLVGHNFRFDTSFLDVALVSHGYPRLGHQRVDTCSLARRLVRDEVPNCRLSTLASRLRLPHQPSHRALDDALATADLLHVLLERAAGLGVRGLDDLLTLPTLAAHPMAAKLRLTAGLPRRPGVYLFRGRGGRVLYVGKATDLRARVRSYFSGDERRKVLPLLREAEAIDHIVCASPLEASVLEVRLIHRHLPPYNQRSTRWRRYAYLKLTLRERFPRLSVVRVPKQDDGCIYLGPLPSTAAARQVAEAIESAVPIRRCRARPGPVRRDGLCIPAQLGVATCPCAGAISEQDYAALVEQVVHGLTIDPAALLEPLERRMRSLADAQRFEEAAETRDRARGLAAALHRQRQLDGLRRAGRLELDVDERRLVLHHGLLTAELGVEPGEATTPSGPDQATAPVPRHLADELACVASWLESESSRVSLVRCEGELACPLPRLPRYEPRQRRPSRR